MLGATALNSCPTLPQVPRPLLPRGHGLPPPPATRPYNKQAFLDPPLPQAPSGTLAAAAAADPFQKGGVAMAWGSAGSVLGLNGGGSRPLSPGRRERCERAPGAYWPRWATLPGLDWAAAQKGRGSSELVLIGLAALVLGTAARQGGRCGWVEETSLGSARELAPVRAPIQAALLLAVLADALAGECLFPVC